MTLVISAVVISAIILVNTHYHGSFLVGLLVIVLPFLVLSYVLPRVSGSLSALSRKDAFPLEPDR